MRFDGNVLVSIPTILTRKNILTKSQDVKVTKDMLDLAKHIVHPETADF